MRAVVQRVKSSNVQVDGQIVGQIDKGLMILLGIRKEDTEKDADYLVSKIVNLRIFEDDDEKLNHSLLDIKGDLLIVSQFTLYGDVKKGRRPSFDRASSPEDARKLYDYFVDLCKKENIKVETGIFQAHMEVALINDGPVTILVDSEKEF